LFNFRIFHDKLTLIKKYQGKVNYTFKISKRSESVKTLYNRFLMFQYLEQTFDHYYINRVIQNETLCYFNHRKYYYFVTVYKQKIKFICS
jgi:hypothetical protein